MSSSTRALALNSELSLDGLLQKIVETAVSLTGARYAALGVIDETGAALERIITTGVNEETRTMIGDLPRGRGILGVLIRDATPLRLTHISDDPRSSGFPPGHPPMDSFLGVPVMLRGLAYGNLYLTEKDGGEFTDEDEELATLLAAQAAVAIENARLYESATRWSRQLESLHDEVRWIDDETDVTRLLTLVCERLRGLTNARLALAALPTDGGERLRMATTDADDAELAAALVGHVIERGSSKSGRVMDRRQSARVDSLYDDPDVDQSETRFMGARTGLYAPLIARGRVLGVIAVHDKLTTNGRFTDGDLRLAEIFASRAAVAIGLSERVASNTVRRVVAAREERRRLALELHDETGQALTSILLGLKAIGSAHSKEEAERAEADVRALIIQAMQDVRALAVELRPSALDDFGLGPALERLAQTFGGGAASRRRPRRGSMSVSRPRSKPRSTGSCRRLSRTSSSTQPPRTSASSSRSEGVRSQRRSMTTDVVSTRGTCVTRRSASSACASASLSSGG